MSPMAVLRRYLAIQAMTLVCGIVGPIFLVVYFAAQPDPTLKWMYWAGLFVTAADILIALAITQSTLKAEEPADVRIALSLQNFRQRHDDS
ncbi:hypothetical protein MMAGJ_37850 [Mycolicibacterium mageritense]|uniref:DUF2530 domain-containing protein n=2 Tax=Mycolicibacterium mageritense TaxID=53462 RepID=A0ABM7HV92_MYCME|nr:hypothetical protein MMAGJ_37850 [Mycolicibacterium mageritense]